MSSSNQYVEKQNFCRYCGCISDLLHPCVCIEPICLLCLRRRVELKNKFFCEFCHKEYHITPEMNIKIVPRGFGCDKIEIVNSKKSRIQNICKTLIYILILFSILFSLKLLTVYSCICK